LPLGGLRLGEQGGGALRLRRRLRRRLGRCLGRRCRLLRRRLLDPSPLADGGGRLGARLCARVLGSFGGGTQPLHLAAGRFSRLGSGSRGRPSASVGRHGLARTLGRLGPRLSRVGLGSPHPLGTL